MIDTQVARRDATSKVDDQPVISVVAPVFNEAPTLPLFVERVAQALEPLGEPWELVLINDGSRDKSLDVMVDLHERDGRVKVVSFSRNFGHQLAITAGLDYARGAAVVIIDSDLQDPPEVIPELFAKWREGYGIVFAQRGERQGETWFKKTTAAFFYRLIRRITNVNIPVDTGDFRLMDRKVVDTLKRMREHHRFMRGLSVWVGFKQTGVEYKRAPRHAGETKYPLSKMVRFALDGITSFSYLPLQLATYFGFAIAAISMIALVAVVIARLFAGAGIAGAGGAFYGQASTLVSVLFLGGIQLIFLGIIGEYLGRIYDEVKRRPLYVVSDVLGLEPQPDPR
jgi:polyisoprenyl-phosphate glycosyltransferase